MAAAQKKLKSGDKTLKDQIELLDEVFTVLSKGEPARKLLNSSNKKDLMALQLITSKPVLYVCNVLEEHAGTGNNFTEIIAKKAEKEGADCVVISSKIEAEISLLESLEEKQEFLSSLNLSETGLSKIIKAGYKLLDLQSFFTIGPKEAHAWTFEKGILAPKAAGIIHTDFEKGFIRAEVISYEDYVTVGNETKIKEMGKMRLEGKEYKLQDGDIIHFRFNV